jgi:hypothetical protein
VISATKTSPSAAMMRPIVAAAVRGAGLGEHRAVIAKRRGLGAEDELDVLEPRVRERAERRPARGGLSRGGLGGSNSVRGALGLDRLDELDDSTTSLVLGQVPRRRPAASRTPAAPTVPDEPRVRAEPPAHPLAVCAAPLDRPHRLARALSRLDQEEGRRKWVVCGHRTTTVHRSSDGGPPADQLESGGPAGGPICSEITSQSAILPLQTSRSKANQRANECLPCRRSRVRVPSAAPLRSPALRRVSLVLGSVQAATEQGRGCDRHSATVSPWRWATFHSSPSRRYTCVARSV